MLTVPFGLTLKMSVDIYAKSSDLEKEPGPSNGDLSVRVVDLLDDGGAGCGAGAPAGA